MSLTRANLQDGLPFEESVQLAIKTIRKTPHHTLKMTPFQLHLARKPRRTLTNLIRQPECLLSKLEKDTGEIHFSPTGRTAHLHDKLL